MFKPRPRWVNPKRNTDMNGASDSMETVIRVANELYWGSERSVNQIAEELDLSKGALYGMIVHLPSGSGCPLCGDEVVYANRTAKEKGRLSCPTCTWDGLEDETVPVEVDTHPEPAGGPTTSSGGSPSEAVRGADSTQPRAPAPGAGERAPPAPLETSLVRTAVGGALLGAAVGLALVVWTRRR